MKRFRRASQSHNSRFRPSNSRSTQRATTTLLVVALFFAALAIVMHDRQARVEAQSSTGRVGIQIVPPESFPSESGNGLISPGTLSASLTILPESGDSSGSFVLEGVFLVADHRSHACEWTARVYDPSANPGHLTDVVVGSPDIFTPHWAYDGVRMHDPSLGISLASTPLVATASKMANGGCGVIGSRISFEVDSASMKVDSPPKTLIVILPAAP